MNNFNYPGNNQMFQKNVYPSYLNSPTAVNASTNNLVWVQGIEGAKAWQLSPNSMIIMLDSETEGKMYIKVSDNIGISTLRTFSYVEDLPPASTNVTINKDLDLSQYVTKEEVKNLIKELIDNEQSISTTIATTDNSNVPKQYKVVATPK